MHRASQVLIALATAGAVTAGGAAAVTDSKATSPIRTRPEADTTVTTGRAALSAAQLSHATSREVRLEEAVRNARQSLLARKARALLAAQQVAAASALAAQQMPVATPAQSPVASPYPSTAGLQSAHRPTTHGSTGASGGKSGRTSDDGSGDGSSGDD
jgi:hypothetical protein